MELLPRSSKSVTKKESGSGEGLLGVHVLLSFDHLFIVKWWTEIEGGVKLRVLLLIFKN